jgi:hypothetical protein
MTCTPSRYCPPLGRGADTGLDHPPPPHVRDYERLPAHHETYIYWAMIIVMTRRLARQDVTTQPTAT